MELYVTVLRVGIALKTLMASSILPDFASWVSFRFWANIWALLLAIDLGWQL